MVDIYIALCVFLIIWHFIYQRQQSEVARHEAKNYCEKNNLQFIAIARKKNNLKFSKRLGLHWQSVFEFEFSGDGESSYLGEMKLLAKKVDAIQLPAFKVN